MIKKFKSVRLFRNSKLSLDSEQPDKELDVYNIVLNFYFIPQNPYHHKNLKTAH